MGWGSCPPIPLIGCDCDKEEDPYSAMLDDVKEDFLRVMDVAQPRAKEKRPRNKAEGSC